MRLCKKPFLAIFTLSLLPLLVTPLWAASYVVTLRQGTTAETGRLAAASRPDLQTELKAWGIPAKVHRNFSNIGCTLVDMDPAEAESIRDLFPGSLVVPGDLKLKASYTDQAASTEGDDTTAQATAWHTNLTSSLLQAARNEGADFDDVYVAILDSGIYDHPDFGNRIRYDLARNTLDSKDGEGANPTNTRDVTDLHGHGTAVTGVIAGSATGVCPEVDIIPVRIANADARADFSDMVEGIDYLVGLKKSGTLSRNARLIVNLSYNTLDPQSDSDPDAEATFRDMVETAADNHILFVASAGNNGTDIDRSFVYPTSLFNENLLSVAATTSSNTLASFSNYGLHTVEIAAPGQSILTTARSGGWSTWNGTSFAAPFSAGVAALLWSMHDELDDIQIRNVLINATDSKRFLSSTAGASSSITVIAGDRMDPSELTDDSFIASAAGSTPITGNETADFVPDDSGTGNTGGVAGGGGGCSATSLPIQALMLLPLALVVSMKRPR